MSRRIRAAWLRLPRWGRAFLTDVAEGAGAAVITLNVFLPHNVSELQSQAIVIGTAVASPAIAAFRRHVLPAAWTWIRTTFAEPPDDGAA